MAYTFIPKSKKDILNSKLTSAKKMADLYEAVMIRTDNYMPDPLAIDMTKPFFPKLHRSVASDFNLKALAKEFSMNSIQSGNGSRGNMGVNNRGNAFERYLTDDFAKYIQTRSLNENYRYKDLIKEYHELYFKNAREIEVIPEGALDKPRPLQFSPQLMIGSSNFDVGSTVTDVTLRVDGEPLYLSLKMGGTITLFQSGIRRYITDADIKNEKISSREGKMILDMFGIEEGPFLQTFKYYGKGSKSREHDEDVTRKVNLNNLHKFLQSALGYGYEYVHLKSPSGTSVHRATISKSTLADITKIQKVVVRYPAIGTTKRFNVFITSKGIDFNINIRNKDGGVNPSHLMSDYKVKF